MSIIFGKIFVNKIEPAFRTFSVLLLLVFTCHIGYQREIFRRRVHSRSEVQNTDPDLTSTDAQKAGTWTDWTSWSQYQCTAPCGGGRQKRWRLCQDNRAGRLPCFGGRAEQWRDCNTDPCPGVTTRGTEAVDTYHIDQCL